jgi:predicted Zn-dependent protease with MMP-like domain
MNQQKRDYFDRQVEHVLNKLPESVTQLLEEIPLHVEDYPSKEIRKLNKIKYIDELCGYFSGVPIGEQLQIQPNSPTSITIFRYGILALAVNKKGKFSQKELRRQIKITILHELGHYHGMDEKEIKKIGYG